MKSGLHGVGWMQNLLWNSHFGKAAYSFQQWGGPLNVCIFSEGLYEHEYSPDECEGQLLFQTGQRGWQIPPELGYR